MDHSEEWEPSVQMGRDAEEEGTHLSENELNHLNEVEVDLRRQEIQSLLSTTRGQEGDDWYLIPSVYLDKFFNVEVGTFKELCHVLGPIDCKSIVDSNGRLYEEDVEPVGTFNVPPLVFHKFREWFGVLGTPIVRSLISNTESGAMEVERYPAMFHVHQLSSKKSHHHSHNHYGHHSQSHSQSHYNNHQSKSLPLVTVSRTKTMAQLVSAIEQKLDKKGIRLWFIDGGGEWPQIISPSTFVFDVEYKRLVTPNHLSQTLRVNGIVHEVYHLVVEQYDKSLAAFPLDNYVASMIKDASTFNQILAMGGVTGLQNLGNTCYMNSALQCLLHVPEINSYFLFNLYKQELNNDNPLGYKGAVANSFGNLLKQMFDIGCGSKPPQSIAPRDFKSTIGRYSSMFYGYLQQDSQEFLSWLLDALHEDLNRIHVKPYNDKPELKDDEIDDPLAIVRLANICWDLHKLRNDSIIVDLFTGMYKSTLVCPDCSKTSITFDPFNDLTLPLPVQKKWYHTFTIVDLTEFGSKFINKILVFEVELDYSSNYEMLVSYLSNSLNIPKEYLFLYELFRNSFYTDFQADNIKNKFVPIGDLIKKEDEVVVYIIPHDPESDTIVPVLNFVPDEDLSYRRDINFGLPLFIVLNKKNNADTKSFGIIRRKLETAIKVLTNVNFEDEYRSLQLTHKKWYKKSDFPSLIESSDDQEMYSDPVDDEEEYDSDVSLANPYISGNFGFEVKRYAEDIDYKPKYRLGQEYSSRLTAAPADKLQLGLSYVPLQQINNISEAVNLIDLLPKKKKEYYYYAEIDQHIEEATAAADSDDSNKGPSSSSDLTEDGFIIVGKSGQSEEKLPVLLEDDTSDHQPPSPSSIQPPLDSESVSVSNINSPQKEMGDCSEEAVVVNKTTPLIVKGTTLICCWNPACYDKLFGDSDKQAWAKPVRIPNPSITNTKHKKEVKTISLYDCLEQFSRPEVLGEHDLWYCPNCKDHKQATKTIQLWSTGDILTIHLKRFHSARAFSDKIDALVDFPIEGLDMGKFISKPHNMDKSNEIYDLIAVDNHYGGLGGGHYTACVKNFRDNKWHYFNDSHVSEMPNPLEVVNSRAYLLFYKRRVPDNILGGDDLQSKLNAGYEALKAQFDTRQARILAIHQQLEQYEEQEAEEEDNHESPAHVQVNLEDETQTNLYDDDDIYESNRKEDLKKTRSNSINIINNDNNKVRKMRLISKEDSMKLVSVNNDELGDDAESGSE